MHETLGTGAGPNGRIVTDPMLREAAAPAGIAPASMDVVAFVGRCLKGPVNEPQAIRGFAEFQQVFGGLSRQSTLSFAIEQFFEQGGRRAVVVRVASGGAPPTIDLRAGDDVLVLQGLCPGSREYLRASVDYDGIGPQDTDLFNLVVQRVRTPGSELVEAQETFRRLSVLAGSAREIGRMLASSKLVRLSGRLPRQRPDITHSRGSTAIVGWVECNRDGDDGQELSDYDVIGSEAARSGLFALQGGPPFSFLYVPPLAADRDVGFSALVVAARFCRQHHALLVVDPPHRWHSAEDAFAGLRGWPLKSPDALLCLPPLYAMDRLSGRLSTFAPGAAAAAMLVREQGREGHWEEYEMPLLRPAAQPAMAIDEAQRERLARLGVNVLAATRAPARLPLAPRTLAGERSAAAERGDLWQRRLTLHVTASIERGTGWVATEGNSERSRERVSRQVERFLSQLGTEGALAGTERNRHWFVLCDERLNTASQQSAGEFRMLYGFQPRHCRQMQSFLVVHRASGSSTRPVDVNTLAAQELKLS